MNESCMHVFKFIICGHRFPTHRQDRQSRPKPWTYISTYSRECRRGDAPSYEPPTRKTSIHMTQPKYHKTKNILSNPTLFLHHHQTVWR